MTGKGTGECLKIGCLPVTTHFYQPIPDICELEQRKVWDKVSTLSGIQFDDDVFLTNLKHLSKWADECNWSEEPTENPDEFYLNNGCFSYGCASLLHSMIRDFKPTRIIEVSSGNSSKIIRDAIKLNEKDRFVCDNYTIIDPYSKVNVKNYPNCTELLKQPVETLEPEFFTQLKENDILFIDSSHVCKTGSDVNFEILEILPALNKEVIIHFYDIELPYEYSKVYFINPAFRVFWTEGYLLQAFLAYNKSFEIILPLCYVQRNFKKEFDKSFPLGKNVQFWGSGSFWSRRVKQ